MAVEELKHAIRLAAVENEAFSLFLIEAGTEGLRSCARKADRFASTVDQGMLSLLALSKGRVGEPLRSTLEARVRAALALGGGSQVENEARTRFSPLEASVSTPSQMGGN